MRYKDTGDILNLGQPVGDDLLVFTVAISIIIGIGFIIAGRKGRQRWMITWGTGLVFASCSYVVFSLLGY